MKIIKIPTSQGCLGKNIGCEKAPNLISEEGETIGINQEDLIERNKELENIKGDIFIGGEHSISYPLVKGFVKENENPGLIVFDAHPDCVSNFNPPTHEDFIKVLVENKIILPERILLIGLRKIHGIEKKFLDKRKINYILFEDIKDNQEIINKINSFSEDKNIYLSVDIDVLNPNEAPGTGYLEEGGMKLEDLIKILKKIRNIKRVDLVEINPDKDIDGKTVNAGKRILEVFV